VLFGYTLHLIGLTFLQTSIPYYFNYIYKDWPGVPNAQALQTMAMGLLLIVAMIFIPISVLVSKKVGKNSPGRSASSSSPPPAWRSSSSATFLGPISSSR